MSGSPGITAKAVFLRARELPAAAREAAVREACRGDEALARDVLELLELDAQLGEERDDAVLAGDPIIGTTIAGYRIDDRIGSGGMGAVYVATEEHPHRQVALKLLRAIVSTPIVRRRFHNESNLLAQLSHPNIAQVHAAGTLEIDRDQVPYFAMELVVDALPLTTYADRRRLTIRERLELLATVCDAVHHGHCKGVIHRDLKPDNILVDRDGNPKLIDFGVARVLDTGTLLNTLQTAQGQLIGTLAYMCPEQCDGSGSDLDTRGDVYSLGVVAYELITGRTPIDLSNDSWVEALGRIARETPLPPSRCGTHIPRALDAILAKALAKPRDRRYGSAADLASDLRAFAAGRPIAARSPGALQRAASWVAEHPVAATAALCALLSLTVVVSLWSLASYYAMTPAALEYDPEALQVRLASRSGGTLFAWPTDPAAEDARLVSLGPEGRLLAMIRYSPLNPRSPVNGHVAFHAVDPPMLEPVWTTAIELEPFESRMQSNPQWLLKTLLAQPLDVFPALPGMELLVVQRLAPGDFISIRVFDGLGKLRYATYHHGVVETATVVQGTNRIVFAGLISERTWAELGEQCDDYPVVLFALEPIDGHRGPTTGFVAGRAVIDPTVAWYKWFGPTAVLGSALPIRGSVNQALGRDGAGCFEFRIQLAERDPSLATLVSWVVDAAGEIRHCYPYDVYKSLRIKGFPPLVEGRLLPLAALPAGR